MVQGKRDREQVGVADGVAGVLCLQRGELGLTVGEELSDLHEDLRALRGRHAWPGALVLRTAGGVDGAVDVLAPRPRHGGDGGAVGGILRLEGLAVRRVDELPIDEELVLAHEGLPRGRADGSVSPAGSEDTPQ